MSWRYKLLEAFSVSAPELLGVSFSNEWLTIANGEVEVVAGYAWDGCSPSARVPAGRILPRGLWLGPWDGPLSADGRPVGWRASLVHDALCQFRSEINGLKKEETVSLFGRMLREDGAPFWMCRVYPWAVHRLGPQSWGKSARVELR